jgi:lysophospholipase L1-like esterase
MLKLIALVAVALMMQPEPRPEAVTPSPRTDAGWVQRNEAFNARAKRGAEMGDIRVVFVGDSITEGWQGAGKKVWEEKFAPLGAVNFGIGGDRTQHVLWRVQNGNLEGLAKPAAGKSPELLVLMIGTNNMASDPAAEIAHGVRAVVGAVRQKLPEARVLVLGIFPRGQSAMDRVRSKIADANRSIANIADGETVVFLDIGERFLEEDGSISPEVMPDFLHLSEKGYWIWGEAIEGKVKEMIRVE